MKTKLTTVHTCDYCNKKYFVESAAIRHETYCGSNPANWPKCQNCNNLEEYKKDVYYGHEDHGYHRECKAFRCTAKNIGLYPAKVIRTGTLAKYPETFDGEELMPKECELYTDELSEIFPW